MFASPLFGDSFWRWERALIRSQRLCSGSWETGCGLLMFGLAVRWEFIYPCFTLTVSIVSWTLVEARGMLELAPIKFQEVCKPVASHW